MDRGSSGRRPVPPRSQHQPHPGPTRTCRSATPAPTRPASVATSTPSWAYAHVPFGYTGADPSRLGHASAGNARQLTTTSASARTLPGGRALRLGRQRQTADHHVGIGQDITRRSSATPRPATPERIRTTANVLLVRVAVRTGSSRNLLQRIRTTANVLLVRVAVRTGSSRNLLQRIRTTANVHRAVAATGDFDTARGLDDRVSRTNTPGRCRYRRFRHRSGPR